MRTIMKIITSPKLTFVSFILGPIFGIYFKNIAENFAFINKTYLALMQVAVIPLIIVTIMSGVLELNKHEETKNDALKIIIKSLILFLAVSIITTLSMLIIKPWISIMDNPVLLSIIYRNEPIIQKTSIVIDDAINTEGGEISFSDFIISAIPNNVFHALSQGDILQIIIFFSIVAIGVASINKNNVNTFSVKLHEIMDIFGKINDSILSVLPFLSFFILSYQIRVLPIETIYALVNLVVCIIVLTCALIIMFIAIVVFRAKKPFTTVIKSMGRCTMLAFLSSSTLITSSLVIKVMIEELKFNKNNIRLIVPVGVGLLRFGSLSIYFIATILTAYLFNKPLVLYTYLLLMVFSIFATFVSISSNNAVAFYQTLPIVMTPLGLPGSSVTPIMVSIDFLLEPLITINNVLGICALAALYSGYEEAQSTT